MKLLKISLFIFIIGFFNSVLALDVPKNIVLDNVGENELGISWDTASGAELYAVSYGKQPAGTGSYEHELEIVVNTDAKALIEKLEADTKYYIAVKSYDSLENESEYSDEVSFSTILKSEELKIDSAKVINPKQLDLFFNINLKNDESLVGVNIVNLENSLEDIEISKYKIEDNILKIFLENELNKSGKYSATVLRLQGKNGEKIQSGVDGIIEFDIPNSFEQIIETEEKINEETGEEANIELNSASEKEQESNNPESNKEKGITENKELKNKIKTLGGKDLDNTDKKAVEAVAKDKEDLPTTGPAETLLFLLLSLIIGALLLMSRRKANS